MVEIYCPNLRGNKGPKITPYQPTEFNQIGSGNFFKPSTPPAYTSVEELNTHLKSLEATPVLRAVDSVTVPEELKQKALQNPGSVTLDEWLKSLKPVEYLVPATQLFTTA